MVGCRPQTRVRYALLTLATLGAVGCGGSGKVTTDGLYVGRPGAYRPIQLDVELSRGSNLEYAVVDLYGPADYARRGVQSAPTPARSRFVLKPGTADGCSPIWEYYVDGKVRHLAHQPGLLVLRGPDGSVSTAAVPSGPAGAELHRLLWGNDPHLAHLKASDTNGLAVPLIRVLSTVPVIRGNSVFAEWFTGYQRWYQTELASARAN